MSFPFHQIFAVNHRRVKSAAAGMVNGVFALNLQVVDLTGAVLGQNI